MNLLNRDRTIYFCFILLILNGHFLFSSRDIFFLSYPHTGTRWALYCLCNLLERDVLFHDRILTEIPKELIPHILEANGDLFRGKFSENQPRIIYGTHCMKSMWVEENEKKESLLILIIRNYREAYLKNYETVPEIIKALQNERALIYYDLEEALLNRQRLFFNNLCIYDLWNPEKRFLIYYEDIIDQPEMVLTELLDVLGEKRKEILENYLENIDWHKEHCLEIIFPDPTRSITRGKDHLYHSRQIGVENCKLIDAEVKKLFPYYFNKYLKRYEMANTKEKEKT